MDWDSTLQKVQAGDTKYRLQALPALQQYAESNPINANQVLELLALSENLLKDNNFRVVQGTIQLLRLAQRQTPDVFRQHVNVILGPMVERLGDPKQPVREEAANALAEIFQELPIGLLLSKASWAWSHKNFRLRQEFPNLLSSLVSDNGAGSVTDADEKGMIEQAVKLLEDPVSSVREAGLCLLGEFYAQTGSHTLQILSHFNIRPPQQREIDDYFSGIDPIQDGVERTKEAAKPPSNVASKVAPSATAKVPVQSSQVKRGGYGDAGGLTASGELPEAEPIQVNSEGELKLKFAQLGRDLDLKNEWDQRIQALMVLEGMLLGGADSYSRFSDELKEIKDGLLQQLNDRRSAVSRVACSLLGKLAIAMGSKFEALAVVFLPALLKVSAISGVQVMADAASEAMETILANCRARGSVAFILNAALSDKSKVVRGQCSKLVVLMLEVWDRKSYERHIELVEKVIASVVQDAQADVRTYGRLSYGAFASACPERVPAFLKRLNPNLRDKMLQAGAEYIRQRPVDAALSEVAKTVQSSRPLTAPPVQPVTSGARPSAPSARSTVAGGALRITPATESNHPIPEDLHPRRQSVARAGRVLAQQQRPSTASQRVTTHETGAKRVPSLHEEPLRDSDDNSSVCTGSVATSGHGMSLATVVNRIKSAKMSSDWEKKRDGFNDMREWLQLQSPSTASEHLSRLMDKIVPLLIDNSKDPHHQVVVAGFEAWSEMCKHATRAQEPYLERLMSCAFLRASDSKAVIRQAVLSALNSAARGFSADTLLAALNKCLNNAKAAKSKTAVMEFTTQALGSGTGAGLPSRGNQAMTSWLENMGKLLSDRNEEVRKVATYSLEHFFKHVDERMVLAYITSSSSTQQAVLKRALHSAVPDLGQRLLAFQREDGFSLVGAHSVSDAERARLVSQVGKTGRRLSGESEDREGSRNSPLMAPLNSTQTRMTSSKEMPLDVLPTVPVAPMPLTTTDAVDHPKDHQDSRQVSGTRLDADLPRDIKFLSDPKGRSARPYTAAEFRDTEGHGLSDDVMSIKRLQITPPPSTPAAGAYISSMYSETPCSTPGSEFRCLDPDTASARLAVLVSRLCVQDGLPAIDTLEDIQRMASYAPGLAWKDNFVQMLYALLGLLEHSRGNDLLQEQLLVTLREMAHKQTGMFEGHLENTISKLLLCCNRDQRQAGPVGPLADECLEELVTRTNPLRCVSILAQRLPSQTASQGGTSLDGLALSRAIRNLGRAAACLNAPELRSVLDQLMPGLVQGMGHPMGNVRKASMFCTVDLYKVLGDELMPHLSQLSVSQMKIVTMYMEKANKQSERYIGDSVSQQTVHVMIT